MSAMCLGESLDVYHGMFSGKAAPVPGERAPGEAARPREARICRQDFRVVREFFNETLELVRAKGKEAPLPKHTTPLRQLLVRLDSETEVRR